MQPNKDEKQTKALQDGTRSAAAAAAATGLVPAHYLSVWSTINPTGGRVRRTSGPERPGC